MKIAHTLRGFTIWLDTEKREYWYGRARPAHGPFKTETEAAQAILKSK